MNQPIPIECASCGRKLKVRAELAGKKAKCPDCGAAVPVPDPAAKVGPQHRKAAPAEPARDCIRYWFFQWGDWSDVKKVRAFFVLTDDALWTGRLEGKAAKRAEESLQAGTHPEEALGDEAIRVPYSRFTEVRTNKPRTNLVVDHQGEEGTASEDFAFADKETRDEVFAELRRRLAGWQYSREKFTPVKAAVAPLVSMGVCAVFAALAVGLAVWFKSWQTENNFVAMVRFVGPIGWAAIGAVAILGLAAWMVVRMRTPPDMLYLRPPDRGRSRGEPDDDADEDSDA
jgi:hypothetical protein